MISITDITRSNFDRYKDDILNIEKTSFSSPWSISMFKGELSNRHSYMKALIDCGRVVGYICFWIVEGELHLMNIAVHPMYRRRGLGRRLLSEMFEEGKEKDVHTAWLEVRPSNVSAINMYRSSGFKEVGLRRGYYDDTKEDAILMALFM